MGVNRITSELMGVIHLKGDTLETTAVSAAQLGSLVDLISSGLISGRIGKEVLGLMVGGDTRPASAIVDEKGWRKISDGAALEKIIAETVLANPERVTKIKQGKSKILAALVGEVMKKTKGRADPQVVNELLKKAIGE